MLNDRAYTFVADPLCNEIDFIPARLCIAHLDEHDPAIAVKFIIPSYLEQTIFTIATWNGVPHCCQGIHRPNEDTPSILSPKICKLIRSLPTKQKIYFRELVRLSNTLDNIDCILVSFNVSDHLHLEMKRIHNLVVLDVKRFRSLLEIILVGNNCFSISTGDIRYTNFNTYYIYNDDFCKRLFTFFQKFAYESRDFKTASNLRLLSGHRYPFVKYSYDMMQFYGFQTRKQTDDPIGRSNLFLGYYLNTFYFMIWGILEHLCTIAKDVYFPEMNTQSCGIRKSGFKRKLEIHNRLLYEKIYNKENNEWIDVIADLRHAASHETINSPTNVVSESDESSLPDDEIWELITKEEDHTFLSDDYLKSMRNLIIDNWRSERRTVVLDNVIILNKENVQIVFSPLERSKFDVEKIQNIIATFITELFNADISN